MDSDGHGTSHVRLTAIGAIVASSRSWSGGAPGIHEDPAGAQASAIVYSIVETARENGLNPRAYLQYLFE